MAEVVPGSTAQPCLIKIANWFNLNLASWDSYKSCSVESLHFIDSERPW